MSRDPETGEYFWTEEEQAWIGDNQETWIHMNGGAEHRRPDRSMDYDAIIRRVKEAVRRERQWRFIPHVGSRYHVTTFKLPGLDFELSELRVYREFDKETKTYKVIKIEYRKKGGRRFHRVPEKVRDRIGEFVRRRFDTRLYIPGLRIYHTGAGNRAVWKDAEYLVGDNINT